jgi:hypothetical protein
VIQRCLVCHEEVISQFHGTSVDRGELRARLFADYDGHRCGRDLNLGNDAELDALYARTESESLRLAEHAAGVTDPELVARVERESELLAIWAQWLSREATERNVTRRTA